MGFPVFIKASRSKVSIAKEIREVNRLRLQHERAMTSRMLRIFKDVGERAADLVERDRPVNEAFVGLENRISEAFRTQYLEVCKAFVRRVNDTRKAEVDFQKLSDQFLRQHGAQLVVRVTQTTKDQINKAVRQGQSAGDSLSNIAKTIRQRTGGLIGRARAATIARTETHAAASFATHEANKGLELPLQKKRWVSVGDSRTREHHRAANGQEVPIDEPFIIRWRGEEIRMQYPHDGGGGAGNNINCRCLAVYFTDEDDLFDSFGLGETDEVVVDAKPKEPEKPFIDIGPLITAQRGLNPQDLVDHFNKNLAPLTATVANKLPKPYTVRFEKDGGVYNGRTRLVESGIEREVIVHEYGHHVDYMLGDQTRLRAWSVDNLSDALDQDRKSLGVFRVKREKRDEKLKSLYDELFTKEITERGNSRYLTSVMNFKGADGISDIIDGLVGGIFHDNYYGYGHGKSYWKNAGSREKETFANLFAIVGHKKAEDWVKKNLPETWAVFTAKLKEVADA